MTRAEAIEKIVKLRELGKSAKPGDEASKNEAKVARSRAASLMAKYAITEVDLAPKKPEAPIAESLDDLVEMVFDTAAKVAGGKWRPQDDPRAAEMLEMLRRISR